MSTFPPRLRGRLIHTGSPQQIKRVRLDAAESGNDYSASVVASGGHTEIVTVTNLAEPESSGGLLPSGTEAIAMQVGGQWLAFVPTTAVFVARITAASGAGVYSIREQALAADGTFDDADDAADLTARNLAEIGESPGNALAVNTRIVAVAVVDTASPATLRYVFDRLPGSAS
jgi:hypothetical protein